MRRAWWAVVLGLIGSVMVPPLFCRARNGAVYSQAHGGTLAVEMGWIIAVMACWLPLLLVLMAVWRATSKPKTAGDASWPRRSRWIARGSAAVNFAMMCMIFAEVMGQFYFIPSIYYLLAYGSPPTMAFLTWVISLSTLFASLSLYGRRLAERVADQRSSLLFLLALSMAIAFVPLGFIAGGLGFSASRPPGPTPPNFAAMLGYTAAMVVMQAVACFSLALRLRFVSRRRRDVA